MFSFLIPWNDKQVNFWNTKIIWLKLVLFHLVYKTLNISNCSNCRFLFFTSTRIVTVNMQNCRMVLSVLILLSQSYKKGEHTVKNILVACTYSKSANEYCIYRDTIKIIVINHGQSYRNFNCWFWHEQCFWCWHNWIEIILTILVHPHLQNMLLN